MRRYFWIRDVDPQTYMRVLKMARARKQSVADTARELLQRYLRTDEPSPKKPRRIAVTARR
jgi:hypothetical protein